MKNIKKRAIRFTAISLSSLMALYAAPAVSAAQTGNEKEEVVYANLNSDGSVDEINVVNIFKNLDGEVVDYGDYESVRNMTTTDKIDYSGGKTKISTNAGSLYYEGKLKTSDLPWNISVKYYLDGKEYRANELAGKSGKLEIKMSIKQNKACNESFFKSFALQTSITLDTKKCSNIKAENATIANVGSDKQITFTLLPGKESDITISADVKNFECDGFSINGVPLSLDIEIDDSELMDKVKELTDATKELDDGAGELDGGVKELESSVRNDLESGTEQLKNGTSELYEKTGDLQKGASSLESGCTQLQSGAASLDEGINSLNGGIGQIKSGVDALNLKSSTLTGGSAEFKAALIEIQTALGGVSLDAEKLTALTNASSGIKGGIDALVLGATQLKEGVSFDSYKAVMLQNGLDIDTLYAGNAQAIANLQITLNSLNEQIGQLAAMGVDTSQLSAQAAQLESVITLLAADNGAIDGTSAYLAGVSGNIDELLSGLTELQTNYYTFDESLCTLTEALGGLVYNMSALSGAINTLVEEYTKLDGGISDYTSGVAEIAAGFITLSDGGEQLVKGSGELNKGTQELCTGSDSLSSGIEQFGTAGKKLKDGAADLNSGVGKLASGALSLSEGSGKLKDGTSEMYSQTSGMDTEISDKIDTMIKEITGSDEETVSFVSDKNTKVDAVQFVIKTEKIEVEEDEPAAADEPQEMNFWQKLLALFGIK